MRILCTVFTAVAIVLIVAALAVGCVQAFAFDLAFYSKEYQKSNTAAYVGVSDADLMKATDALLSYIQDKRDNIDLTVQIDGESREYYNAREKAHMVDVKNLYVSAVNTAVYGSIAAGVLLALNFVLLKKKALRTLLPAFYKTSYVILAGFAAIAVWAGIDFFGFWTAFHRVFFTNDLWQLDPSTDLMIRMFETQFFFDMVFKILLVFLGIFVGAVIAARIAHKKLVQHEQQ